MMKTAVYIQKGEALNYVNNTQSKIPANTVLLLGNRLGIAGCDIEPGELGALHVVGVFEIPKKAGESIKIIQGKLKHNKKRFPIPGAFPQHVFGDLIPLIC